MNCNSCGTQLPPGAVNCPQCGAATEEYYSPADIGPNDPTVVSSPEPAEQQPPQPTVYGSSPYAAVPASSSDTPSYGTALQDPYSSSPYQSPYDPYNVAVPPPPSPQRPGKRTGIIVAVVLLVGLLLLIGGGVLALLEYASARNAATTTHATATTIVTGQNFTANGTFTILNTTNTSFRQDGQNKIYSDTVHGVDDGDLTGSYTEQLTSIVHPDNTSNFSGNITCTCTVADKSGTLMYSFSGTSTANGSFQGQLFNFQGTGDLAKLHGQGVFQGQGSHGTYSLQLHFDS